MKNSKSKNNTVLLLDPRGIVLSDLSVTASRQYEYAKKLSKLDSDLKYIVFSSFNGSHADVKRVQFEIINLYHKTFNSFVFAYLAYKKIFDRSIDVKLIAVGDPWESYWSAYFLNKFLKSKIPIQIQVHGDIANSLWRKINLKNRFRFFLAKSSLNKCEVIRCVSKEQKLNLVNAFGLDKRKIIVIPVPIAAVNNPLVPAKRPRTIGLIGRIHEDRGIWNFVELVKNLNKLDTNFKLLIVGDGPARDKFINQLEKVIPKNRIKYLGQISQGTLRSSWKSIGVLVSMAPVESYGRVLRESLLAGVPVWATASSGVVNLLNSAEPGTVKVLDFEKDESGLYKDFESLLKVKVGSKFRDKFIKENNSYADKLAKSWIDTIENQKK
jgi:glycosyltransferase involved in cell wall biosynthesis